MKKVLLFLLAVCWLAATAGDDDPQQRINALINQQSALKKQVNQAFKKKDYATVAELNYRALDMVDSNRVFLESWVGSEQVNAVKAEFHYYLACSYSLRNYTEGAFYHLRQAAALGFDKWKHLLEDPDFNNISHDARFGAIVNDLRAHYDYLTILKNAGPYVSDERSDTLPQFTYQSPEDPNLQRVREYFNLEKVAGNGDEISRIKNIMTHVHNMIKHDGRHGNPEHVNAIDMAQACKDGSRGLNCRGLAILLNECYLAMGIPSRYVTCMPKEFVSDCHVINAVWSSQLGKWLWIDPSFNAWVTDKQGNMLGIQEVRECLRNGTPVVLNKKANWNNSSKQTTQEYLYNYMAKNLYYLVASTNQEFGLEDRGIPNSPHDAVLLPAGYTPDYDNYRNALITNDDSWFWQAPR